MIILDKGGDRMEQEEMPQKSPKYILKILGQTLIICLVSYFLFDYIIGWGSFNIEITQNATIDEALVYLNIIISVIVIPLFLMKYFKMKYSFIFGFICHFLLIYFLMDDGFVIRNLESGFLTPPPGFIGLFYGFVAAAIQRVMYSILNKDSQK